MSDKAPKLAPHQDNLHKPDIRKANVCPTLPTEASGLDAIVYWLGIGLGSGLPKRAPGTWGTLGGLIIAIPLMALDFVPFLLITLIANIVGIWICDRTSVLMRVHDDPHIVWDEWAGIWITLLPLSFALTYTPQYVSTQQYWFGIVLAFILFRLFDIIKPNPIKWIDLKVRGGLGIMLDDVIAAFMAAILWLVIAYVGVLYYPL